MRARTDVWEWQAPMKEEPFAVRARFALMLETGLRPWLPARGWPIALEVDAGVDADDEDVEPAAECAPAHSCSASERRSKVGPLADDAN